MANFYTENKDIVFHMQNMDLQAIVALREDNFHDKDSYLEAPVDYADAKDNYAKILELVGAISGEFIAPRSSDVDLEGAEFIDGEVQFAKGTQEALDVLKKADLMGITLPRRYGGLNLPKVIYSMAIEMVSRADASLMNIFGLQEIADTIYKFGTEDQRKRYLPRFSNGEVLGSMALTEPDAGSDLQAVMLKAYQKDDGKWYLDGVKRFITNGCAKISLVMARSEESISGGRGISLFVYEREPNMRLRRIEDKLGIHGSPTCEMQFNDAPAELLGQRKFGLIKYTMSLMNGARLAVSAQAVGIAEAAYREAEKYAKTRQQFGQPIEKMPAMYEMLTNMKVLIEASRSLLYETSRLVDMKEGIEDILEHHPERKNELAEDLKRYTKYASLFTPILKIFATEYGNKVCYDALQIHGGNGYMQDFNIERHVRDIRITNIYEGTTQLQVLAGIGGVISGVVFERLDEYEHNYKLSETSANFTLLKEMRAMLQKALDYVKEKNDRLYQQFHERRLVEIATDLIVSYLLSIDALHSERKKVIAHIFVSQASLRVIYNLGLVVNGDTSIIEYNAIVNE